MPAHSRTPFQREADRVRITELYLQGKPQHIIAQALEISRQQVGYDIAVIEKRWLAATVRNLDEDKARELSKTDNLERTYWESWERSREPRKATTTSRRTSDEHILNLALLHEEQRDGNPAFLQGVQWCIDRRCKLLALDPAPVIKVGDNREVHILVIEGGSNDDARGSHS